jgi:hypothetical protein
MIAFGKNGSDDARPEMQPLERNMQTMSRDDVIGRYANGGPLLVYATAGIPEEHARKPIGPGEWTLAELIAHLVDSDLNGAERMKRVIAEENPTLMAYDETAWAKHLDYAATPIDEAVALFAANRKWMTRILKTLPDDAFARMGNHSETGPLTLAALLAKYIGHLDHHLRFLYGKRSNLGCAVPPRYTAQ